ncbi:uncharacterized protein CTHT_0048090 [Thermochaetoides thermophila DSM 1495]|uniref:Uncharacterized protein n=1 Tax=Chaetomium thermophilum (strain DSM 1495 / CBS 144.50 / IMI 039719) TaxID=759272 RepID=G0SAX1_CHATD|nr:hypothetical protein CTHT_0048090 [Thermochaetoides thermophila DSM 1495]EGS19351.1 hypothetical protein CTHT_0048090 [Thermochaetoides thermophila DSM 1495]
MLLKRKRSESEFSFSPVFSSSHSVNDGFNFNAMSAMDTARRGFFSPRLSVPSHLPSRTLKRFRDNRPPEEEIHQRTLHLLYSAQHRPQELNSQLSQSADLLEPANALRAFDKVPCIISFIVYSLIVNNNTSSERTNAM